jgi:hypothetical protein
MASNMRMHMRGFNCLKETYSKKIETCIYSISFHLFNINFCKIYQIIKDDPAMQPKVTEEL